MISSKSKSAKTREFSKGVSSLNMITIRKKEYKKQVHVNICDNTACLMIVVKDIGHWCGSDYYPLDNLPNFISRHIDFNKVNEYLIAKKNKQYHIYVNGLFFENGKEI